MIRFESPILLAVSLALVACAAVAVLVRRVDLRPITCTVLASGLVFLALAAGGVTLELRHAGRVAVMVDVSPSTRTAAYHSREALDARVAELLGDVRREVREFSSELAESSLAGIDAVLLFSDGRFDDRTVSSPTYAVIDPELSRAADARVAQIEVRDGAVAATVLNPGDARVLKFNGSGDTTVAGSQVVVQRLPEALGAIVAALGPGDAWPENDSLSIHAPPPERRERWWVGESAPSDEWVAIAPTSLPLDPAEYLLPSLIVLDNVAADALSVAQQGRLLQYVRDLGGGVILLGGDRAFAAGGYLGTNLETLSPLSSAPPQPTTHWVLLVDASGSMAVPAADANATRWQLSAAAVARVLPHVPPQDPVSIGSFARDLRWWSRGKPARELADLVPPADIAPRGPTNLQSALESLIAIGDGSSPTEVLVLTDAEAKLDVDALAAPLRSKRIRVHLLATSNVSGDHPMRRLVESTGGIVLAQADPQRWSTTFRELLLAASPPSVSNEPHEIRFTDALAALPARTVEGLNHVWPKDRATRLATSTTASSGNGGPATAAAVWNVGAGRAAAVAFTPTLKELEAIAQLVASSPSDARFSVSWDADRALRVSVGAADGERMLNGLNLTLELVDPSNPSGSREAHAVPQVAPGQYECSLPAPRAARLATLRRDDRIVARRAIAGRYAAEFDEIGVDRAALRSFAKRTGGRVIEPTDTGPIDFNWPRRRVDLTAALSTVGAMLIAIGLIRWKIS